MPSLLKDISNKQNVKKYQIRIIRILQRSWAWQGVEKLTSKMASLRFWGEGSAVPLTPSSAGFHDFHCVIIFQFFSKFFQFFAVALL